MRYLTAVFMVFISSGLMAQQVIPLYEGKIPGAKPTPADYVEESPQGADKITRTAKVSIPTLIAFLPTKEKATGAAVVICPGGGYGILAIDHEGYNVAKRFNEFGGSCFCTQIPPAQSFNYGRSVGRANDGC